MIGTPMIVAAGLQKIFDGHKRKPAEAVRDVSFTVYRSEIFGLLGPNGAGKTTTLRMLATLLKPTAGTAILEGLDVVHDSVQVRRQIGFLSGDMGQYGRLTAHETLLFFARLNGLPTLNAQRRVYHVIEQFDLRSFSNVKIDRLSTGMRQRVAIARAVIHDPPILILDEPSSGLDVPSARQVGTFMQSARSSGKCVLLSTHLMEEAEYLCDRVAIINRGRITATGTVAELRTATGKQRLRDVFLALLEVHA